MEKKNTNIVRAFFVDESGATAIEYGLIVALIAAGIIGSVTAFGTASGTMYDNLSDTVTSNNGSG